MRNSGERYSGQAPVGRYWRWSLSGFSQIGVALIVLPHVGIQTDQYDKSLRQLPPIMQPVYPEP